LANQDHFFSVILPAGFLAVTPLRLPSWPNGTVAVGRAAGSAASPLQIQSGREERAPASHSSRRLASGSAAPQPVHPFFVWSLEVPSEYVEEPWVATVFNTIDSDRKHEQTGDAGLPPRNQHRVIRSAVGEAQESFFKEDHHEKDPVPDGVGVRRHRQRLARRRLRVFTNGAPFRERFRLNVKLDSTLSKDLEERNFHHANQTAHSVFGARGSLRTRHDGCGHRHGRQGDSGAGAPANDGPTLSPGIRTYSVRVATAHLLR
jgi:hypothetical protein